MRHIAIIGQGPGHEDAPKDMERWGLPWAKDYTLDLYFEMHSKENRAYYKDDPAEVIMDCGVRVLMDEPIPEATNSFQYPTDEILDLVGGYIESSVGYAFAYAIFAEVDEISLYGVSGDDGYTSQRPNLEYLIGFARARGIKVNVQKNSHLLRSNFAEGRYGLGGFLENPHGFS